MMRCMIIHLIQYDYTKYFKMIRGALSKSSSLWGLEDFGIDSLDPSYWPISQKPQLFL